MQLLTFLAKIKKINVLNQFIDIISVLLTLNNDPRLKSADKYVFKRRWRSEVFNTKTMQNNCDTKQSFGSLVLM